MIALPHFIRRSCLLIALASPAAAELPGLTVQEWLGFFAGYHSRRCDFGFSVGGEFRIFPLRADGTRIGEGVCPTVNFGIAETYPDGKVAMKKLTHESLQADGKPREDLEKLSWSAATAGDAKIEGSIERERDVFHLSGKLVDKGEFTRNPIRFAIQTRIPPLYRNDTVTALPKNGKASREDKDALKKFERKVEDDRIELIHTDGSRTRLKTTDMIRRGGLEGNTKPIRSFELTAHALQDRTIIMTAGEGSSFSLDSFDERQLHEGFYIRWTPDAEITGPDARMTVEVK